MKVKEFLKDIKRKKTTIEMLEDQMERLKIMAEYKGVAIDPNGGSKGSRDPHNNETLIAKAVDISVRLDKIKEELMEDIERATEMISSLSDDKVLKVFWKRYLNFQTWESIATDMDISFQWVHELHKRGLIELYKRYANFFEK